MPSMSYQRLNLAFDRGRQSGAGTSPITVIARAAAGLVAAALLLSGCGFSSPSLSSPETQPDPSSAVAHANRAAVENDDQPRLGGKLAYGLAAETNGWNPSTNQWGPAGLIVARSLFDTLAAFDEQSQVHPFLAQSIDHNNDFTLWTIKLRPGVVFHNGKPVTANAIVRSFNYFKSSPVTGGAFTIMESIKAQDDLTVALKTTVPFVSFPGLLTTQVGVVTDPDWLTSNDSKAPVGTGPFKLEHWDIGTSLIAQKNKSYWRKDARGIALPYLDTVEFRIISDGAERAAELTNGTVDIIEESSGQQIQDFQKREGYQVISDGKGETAERFVMLNTMKAPFDDPDARLALAYATDKKEFNDVIAGGFGELANGPFAPSSPWYTESGYPQYNPEKARALVAAVKAHHGGKFQFDLSAITDSLGRDQVTLLQRQWEEVGIDAHIALDEGSKRIISIVTGNYQAAMWLQFDSAQPLLDGVWWDPSSAVPPPAFSLNFARNKDTAIGNALERGLRARDDAGVKDAMADVQKRLAIDLPYIWLYHEHTGFIASNRLVNITRYTLPDGAVGLNINQGSHPISQIWIQ